MKLWRAAGLAEEQDLSALYFLTGGQPAMAAMAASAVAKGQTIDDFLSSAHETYFHMGDSSVSSARYLLAERAQSVFSALLSSREIASFRDRELLWIAGVIRSAKENPPVIASSLAKEALIRCISENGT